MILVKGDRIKFKEEVQSYKVEGSNDRFIIATKPLNGLKTYLYTIVDLVEGIRGPDNYSIGNNDYQDPIQVVVALGDLLKTKELNLFDGLQISHRRNIPLQIEEIFLNNQLKWNYKVDEQWREYAVAFYKGFTYRVQEIKHRYFELTRTGNNSPVCNFGCSMHKRVLKAKAQQNADTFHCILGDKYPILYDDLEFKDKGVVAINKQVIKLSHINSEDKRWHRNKKEQKIQ